MIQFVYKNTHTKPSVPMVVTPFRMLKQPQQFFIFVFVRSIFTKKPKYSRHFTRSNTVADYFRETSWRVRDQMQTKRWCWATNAEQLEGNIFVTLCTNQQNPCDTVMIVKRSRRSISNGNALVAPILIAFCVLSFFFLSFRWTLFSLLWIKYWNSVKMFCCFA